MTRLGRLALLAVLLTALGACEREERDSRPSPVAERDEGQITVSAIHAGPSPSPSAPGYPAYTENAHHVAEGKRLFDAFNCSGCHAHGGGGMGPPLMDETWIYGSGAANIYATIVEGRPNGMPSFRGRIPEQQVWELAAYVRSLGGLARKDVASGRDDHLSARPSEQRLPAQAPVGSGSGPAVEGR